MKPNFEFRVSQAAYAPGLTMRKGEKRYTARYNSDTLYAGDMNIRSAESNTVVIRYLPLNAKNIFVPFLNLTHNEWEIYK